ncbi:MAG: amidoligase family protein [Gemmatimonadales bacterium]
MTARKFSHRFKYKPLNKYEGLLGKIVCRAPTTYVGVEIELENVSLKYSSIPSSFTRIEDGSLKLEGAEFITIPIKVCFLEEELKRLFKSLRTSYTSSRCSVHVHLNARDLTSEELKKLLLLYCIFEKSLFHFSGNRWDNIFCVPLYSYPELVGKMLMGTTYEAEHLVGWYKYFALNLSPLWGGYNHESAAKLGTIEFRHMEGTTNTERILTWINLIISLKIAAKKLDLTELIENIKVMNTTSAYYWLATQVFGDWETVITSQKTFQADVEACITSIKCLFFNKENPLEFRERLAYNFNRKEH